MLRKFSVFIVMLLSATTVSAQSIPTPKEHFGFNIGDDYQLTTYDQAEAYFKKLAISDRTKLVDIGLTEEGRHQYMLIVSSPANIKKLDHYKEISQKLARASDLTEDQAKALAMEGKAVVWIDGGLHATEVVGAHQLIETMYQFVTRQDTETLQLLDEAIILFAHANPDGQQLVSDWYMRTTDPKKRSFSQLPRLYQKYIGHDNNRDFFMMNMKESQNISNQLYVEWIPQIVYNHHQTGPEGSVLAGPPYRDPFNYVYDPLLVTSLDAIGAAMISRLNMEGKPGYTQRSGSNYSTWWNGGLRTTPYFHNMIGILTEIIGGPAPSRVPLVPGRLIPNMATPFPVTPQEWHFRQSIDYSVSLNYAVVNFAVNNRKDLLYGIYRMGRNSINRGSNDYWTLSPKYVDSINNAYRKDQRNTRSVGSANSNEGGVRLGTLDTIPQKYFNVVLKDSTLRDPRGYIFSADQPDFPTAVKFINALIRSGILVHKATADFSVEGKKYPAGSYVIKTAQAFRPHLMDMLEPQDHPNDFLYPGGPPIRPYDAAGWTLAYEMGVKFDRILNGFEGPFQQVPYGSLQSPKVQGSVAASGGYLLDARSNDAFIAVNDLLKAGIEVYRSPKGIANIAGTGPGTFFIPAGGRAILQKAVAELGVKVTSNAKRPADAVRVSPLRVGLWDNYGGSMPSGWVRWLMEQYHFPFQVIYPGEIDKGNLHNKYDVIVFVTGAIPAVGSGVSPARGYVSRQPKPEEIPAAFRPWLGRISADTSIPQIKSFLEAGGLVVAVGSSTNLAYHLKLPVRNALVEIINGEERNLPGEKFYIPGSILRVSIDSTQPAAWGMASVSDVYFDASPVFNLAPNAIAKGKVKPLMWFSSDKPLRSGWAWGQSYLQDGVAAFSAQVGKGTLYAFGPEIAFRAQTHANFKLLFNQLYRVDQKAESRRNL